MQYQHNIKRKPTLVDLARMRQGENQSFDEFVIAWKKVAMFIKLNEKELKYMLIKSLWDEMILEFFNYLEQSLLEMILSMIQKEKHLVKIGLWGHKKERKPPIEKEIDTVVAIIETRG